MSSAYWDLDERPPRFTFEGRNAIGMPWLMIDSGVPLALKGFNCHGAFASLYQQQQQQKTEKNKTNLDALLKHIHQRKSQLFPLAPPSASVPRSHSTSTSSSHSSSDPKNNKRNNNAIFYITENRYRGFQYLPFHPALQPAPSPSSPLSSRGSPRSPFSSKAMRKGNLSSVFSGSSSVDSLHLWTAVFAGSPRGKEQAEIFVEPFLNVTDVTLVNDNNEKDYTLQVSISTAHVGPLTPRAFVDGEMFVCLGEDGTQHSVLASIVDNDETSFTVRVPSSEQRNTSSSPRPSAAQGKDNARNTPRTPRSQDGSTEHSAADDDEHDTASFRSLDQLSIHSAATPSGTSLPSDVPIQIGDTILPSPPGCSYFRYLRTLRFVPNTSYTQLTANDEVPFNIAPFRTTGNRTYTPLGSPHGSERIRTFINPEDNSLFYRQGRINFTHLLPPLATGFLASAEVINSATLPDSDKASTVMVSMDGCPRPHASVGRRRVSEFGQGVTVPLENMFANGRQVAWIAVNHFNSAARITIRGWME